MTPEYLRKILNYDPETGVFTWKIDAAKNVKRGKTAGSNINGYTRIDINRKTYKAHRLAWLYVYGELPLGDLDHINRIRNDNRICNLRVATRQLNSFNGAVQKNNKVGVKGVTKYWNKYRATIRHNGKNKVLGAFATIEEAADAYKKEYKRITGDEYLE